MQKIRSDNTWPAECFREYAEHSVEHDNLEVKEDGKGSSPNGPFSMPNGATDSDSLAA